MQICNRVLVNSLQSWHLWGSLNADTPRIDAMTGFPKICMPTPDAIQAAARALNNAQLVGMPTETVYGLGAEIDQEAALEAVFAYKQRPFEDPLIVHVLTAQDALGLWNLNAKTRPLLKALMDAFWPGPLTLVARAQDGVSRLVRGGGDAVGVRSPAHPVARALIEAAGVPVAAPSANLFGHVSPTRAQHVADDFHDRPLLILDGDASTIGIESTVLKVDHDGHLRLLRHGAIGEAWIPGDPGTKHPRPQLRIDDARILADPTDAGTMRVDALLNLVLVDEVSRLEWPCLCAPHPLDERQQPILDDLVIILPARVTGHPDRVVGTVGTVGTGT